MNLTDVMSKELGMSPFLPSSRTGKTDAQWKPTTAQKSCPCRGRGRATREPSEVKERFYTLTWAMVTAGVYICKASSSCSLSVG